MWKVYLHMQDNFGQMEKPNVESIDGLSPAIAIDQKLLLEAPDLLWNGY